MFKSIQKSGRIAAVAIGLLAALSPLAAPPAALAGGSVPTPELEKSYSFKVSSDNSFIGTGDDSKFGYLYDYDYDDDDGYSLKSITLINLNDGSTSPIAIPKKSLDSATINRDQLYWNDGTNLVVFSPDNQSQTAHPISSAKYAYTGVVVSNDGKRAAVRHYDYESELKKIEIYDLKSDKLIQTYQSDKDDSYCYYSDDMSRLYFLPYDAEKGVVSLRVFNCDTGSTELKTVTVKKDDRSSDINYIVTSSNSDDIYLQSDTTLIKADRDGNMSVLFNDDDHAPEWLYSYPSAEFYALYTKKGSNDLFEEDEDGDYYLNEKDANLDVYDLNDGKIISSIAFPFGDGYLGDISHDGGIMLGTYSNDDKSSACLVDAKTGAKNEFDSHWCSPYFMNRDREIWTDYYDDDDPTTLHVNIYKSNIPHSVPDDVLYFVQTHLPFVIGGGVAIVFIIGGAIVVLCIRKKRANAANGMATTAPKPQRKQRRRQKRARQNAVVPTAPAAPTEPARFCRHCGTPLVPEAQFCPACGQKVD